MRKAILCALPFIVLTRLAILAQDIPAKDVPAAVKNALTKKYPQAGSVSWEKENGNYEANWGGKSGEDTSVQFTPGGRFVEQVDAIPLSELPAPVPAYVSTYYKGAKIKQVGKGTDAYGKHFFEAEISGKDLIFDENGKFVKKD